MIGKGNYRWLIMIFIALSTVAAGLVVGKLKEKDYVGQLYARTDFTLLDETGDFFQLSKLPETRLLLLVFTPDSIHPRLVKIFQEFSARLPELKNIGIDTKMITRTNREIARNFKEASRFPGRLLIDTSGTVGRNIGIWPDMNPVAHWGYALMDNKMQVFWATVEAQPISFDGLMTEMKKLSSEAAGKKTTP